MMLLLAMEYGRMLVRKKCHHKEEHLVARILHALTSNLQRGRNNMKTTFSFKSQIRSSRKGIHDLVEDNCETNFRATGMILASS